MSLTNIRKLSSPGEYQMDQSATSDMEAVPAEGATSIPMEGNLPTLSGDWSYSATAEGRTGETAVNGVDLDLAPGIIYAGPSGASVRVQIKDFDIDEGTINGGATDTVTLALYVNNDQVATADEGFVTELEVEAVLEFNLDTYVGPLQELDVLRVAYFQGSENAELDLEVLNTGSLNIV